MDRLGRRRGVAAAEDRRALNRPSALAARICHARTEELAQRCSTAPSA
jgi:hypothetical protein